MSKQRITYVHHENDVDLSKIVTQAITKGFENFKENFQQKQPTIWITRKQVGEILSISLVSVDIWTKKGVLIAYRIGNKKRFKRTEVESALTKIEF